MPFFFVSLVGVNAQPRWTSFRWPRSELGAPRVRPCALVTGELRGTCDDLRRFRRNVQIPMYTSTSSPDLPWLDLNAVSRPKNPYGVDFHGTRQWLHLDHLL